MFQRVFIQRGIIPAKEMRRLFEVSSYKNSIEKPKSVFMERNCPSLKGFRFHKSGIAMVRLCDVSNWSVFFMYIWYVLLTSQIGQSHLYTSWYVSATSQFGQSLLHSSWYVFPTTQIGPSFLGIIWYVLLTYQIGQSHLGASWYVSANYQFGQSLLGTSCYVFSTSLTGHIHLGIR